MARYRIIRKMDIADGPGVRVSIFFQGCPFHCKNCFNEETWPFDDGKEFTGEEINHIIDLANEDYYRGLSILGGESLHPNNIDGATLLAKKFKEIYKNKKDIWLWTGYSFEEVKDKEIMNYIDYVVDGRYVEDLHDFRLLYRGSKNQRIIDVKKSIKNNNIVIMDERLIK
jgi:anaerobic ribonucleoside-triphosphate reductase activating protein